MSLDFEKREQDLETAENDYIFSDGTWMKTSVGWANEEHTRKDGTTWEQGWPKGYDKHPSLTIGLRDCLQAEVYETKTRDSFCVCVSLGNYAYYVVCPTLPDLFVVLNQFIPIEQAEWSSLDRQERFEHYISNHKPSDHCTYCQMSQEREHEQR